MKQITAVNLYLDLMKKCITDTLFSHEPDLEAASQVSFIKQFIEHYVRGRAVSMLPSARLDNVQQCVEHVITQNVPGDVIETGVWRGGTTIFMRAILAAHEIRDRQVWVADSFEGLPKPDSVKYPIEAKARGSQVMNDVYKGFAADIEEVKANFARFGLLDNQVAFLKGWFKDTLPTAPIKQLAVLRLDGDYYESTMDALSNLYDKLSVGGFVIIDDYGEDEWTYCRKAVDDFRRDRAITDMMVRVDSKCYYWQRSK
jgi:macrocin-O-methyltransferase TylF-like protien